MKKIFVIVGLLCMVLSFGQFSVDGSIKGSENKVVFTKIVDGGDETLIAKTIADSSGNFNSKIPVKYSGIVIIEIQNGARLELLSANEDLQFSGTIKEGLVADLQVTKGESAKGFNEYSKMKRFESVNNDVFPYLMSFYNENDDFYAAIKQESNRIEGLTKNLNVDSNELLKYYTGLHAFISDKNTPNAQTILNRLTNDPEYIETTGLFSKLVLTYLQSSVQGVEQTAIAGKLDEATDKLLKAIDLETFRGQKALSTVLQLLPKEQFGAIHKKYIDKIESLSCSKTDEIKELISQSKIKEGTKAPNIKFTTKQKGAKSLYDIKADKKVLMFWASWCPHCQNEIPFVKEYYNNLKAENGELIAISLDYDENDYKKAIKDFEWINHSDLLKWDGPTSKLYGVNATPTFIVLDKDNNIVKIASKFNEILE